MKKWEFAGADRSLGFHSRERTNVIREAMHINDTRCTECALSPNQIAADSRDGQYGVIKKTDGVCDEWREKCVEWVNGRFKNYAHITERGHVPRHE
jgi:hypothetical protein